MHVSLHKAFDFQSDAQPIRGYLRRSDLGCRVIHLRAAVALLINMGVGLDLVGRGIGCEFRVNRLGEREPKAIERRVDFANLEGRLAGPVAFGAVALCEGSDQRAGCGSRRAEEGAAIEGVGFRGGGGVVRSLSLSSLVLQPGSTIIHFLFELIT